MHEENASENYTEHHINRNVVNEHVEESKKPEALYDKDITMKQAAVMDQCSDIV